MKRVPTSYSENLSGAVLYLDDVKEIVGYLSELPAKALPPHPAELKQFEGETSDAFETRRHDAKYDRQYAEKRQEAGRKARLTTRGLEFESADDLASAGVVRMREFDIRFGDPGIQVSISERGVSVWLDEDSQPGRGFIHSLRELLRRHRPWYGAVNSRERAGIATLVVAAIPSITFALTLSNHPAVLSIIVWVGFCFCCATIGLDSVTRAFVVPLARAAQDSFWKRNKEKLLMWALTGAGGAVAGAAFLRLVQWLTE